MVSHMCIAESKGVQKQRTHLDTLDSECPTRSVYHPPYVVTISDRLLVVYSSQEVIGNKQKRTYYEVHYI